MEKWEKGKFKIELMKGQKNSTINVMYPRPGAKDGKGRLEKVIMFSSGDMDGEYHASDEQKQVFIKDTAKAWINFMIQKNPVDPVEYFHLLNSAGGYSGSIEITKQMKSKGWKKVMGAVKKKNKPKDSGTRPI